MNKVSVFLSVFFLCLLVTASDSFAQSIRRCVNQANQEAAACKVNCEQTRSDAVLNCRVPDGDCGDGCKAAYQACTAPFETERETCLDACITEFEGDRTACSTECSCTLDGNCASSACFGACMFGPAVDRAVCRVSCWRDSTVKQGMRACRQALRACTATCD